MEAIPDLTQFGSVILEILLASWGLLVLLIDAAITRKLHTERRRGLLGLIALVGCGIAFVWLIRPLIGAVEPSTGDPDPVVFHAVLADDMMTRIFNGLLLLGLALVISLSLASSYAEDWGAYFALLIWSTVGMMFLIASEDLLLFFLSLEMMALCLYQAAAIEKGRSRSAEAGMKYFIYGSVASALLLFGLSLIYGMTGQTQYALIRIELGERVFASQPAGGSALVGDAAGSIAVLLVLVGLGFKVALVPFHQWAPDTYEGAPAPVSAWIASGSKVASFVALIKLLVVALGPWAGQLNNPASKGWIAVLVLVSAATMTFGNLAALGQKNFKRMLGYASIAHTGYIMVGVLATSLISRKDAADAASSVLFYLVIYGLTTIGAFGAAAWLSREKRTDNISDLNGLGYRSPGLAACVVVLMLSLIGVPPLAGFFAKLYVFMEVLKTSEPARTILLALVGLALLNTVISAYYYVRVLRAMFLREEPRDQPRLARGPVSRSVAWPITLGALVAVAAGVLPAPLLEAMRMSSTMMLAINPPPQERLQTGADPTYDPRTDPDNSPEVIEQRKRMLQGVGRPGG